MKQSIVIIGKRWFDRRYGNTYFSAVGLINGAEKAKIYYEYGYGDQYADRIFDELEKAGHLPGREHYGNGGAESPWRYCERNNITLRYSASDVRCKRDL